MLYTNSKEEAENLLTYINHLNSNIQFELELPNSNNKLNLLDVSIEINKESGNITSTLYRKDAKKAIFINATSHQPTQKKNSTITAEFIRANKLSSNVTIKNSVKQVQTLISENGYDNNKIKKLEKRAKEKLITPTPQDNNLTINNVSNHHQNSNNNNNNNTNINNNYNENKKKKYYLPLPFISDSFNSRIRSLFKKHGYSTYVSNKSNNTLRKNLNKNMPKHQYVCRKRNECVTKQDQICHRTNVIYKISCRLCSKFYIGSTSQHLHERVDQHLKNTEGSINEHLINEHLLHNIKNKKENIRVEVAYQCPKMKDLLHVEAILTKPHINKNYLLNKKEELKDIMCII